MANRVHPTPHDADNYAGSLPAARNDWRRGDADSMSARDSTIPLQMPDIRLQAKSRKAINLGCSFYLREESIYDVRQHHPHLVHLETAPPTHLNPWLEECRYDHSAEAAELHAQAFRRA